MSLFANVYADLGIWVQMGTYLCMSEYVHLCAYEYVHVTMSAAQDPPFFSSFEREANGRAGWTLNPKTLNPNPKTLNPKRAGLIGRRAGHISTAPKP